MENDDNDHDNDNDDNDDDKQCHPNLSHCNSQTEASLLMCNMPSF